MDPHQITQPRASRTYWTRARIGLRCDGFAQPDEEPRFAPGCVGVRPGTYFLTTSWREGAWRRSCSACALAMLGVAAAESVASEAAAPPFDVRGELALWSAVLLDALRVAAGGQARSSERRDLEEWIAMESDGVGSLSFVTNVLRLDVETARRKLAALLAARKTNGEG